MFEALIIAENPSSLTRMEVAFRGSETNYGPYSINGMGFTAVVLSVESNNLLIIRMEETLDPNDNEAVYEFMITTVAFISTPQIGLVESQVRVILNEISKLFAIAAS